MKKLTLLLAAGLIMAGSAFVSHAKSPVSTTTIISVNGDFMKSTDGTWEGMMNGKTYWYKLDKNAKLWWSMDGKKWAEVKDGMWADKEGKWLKIHEHKLVWSADKGKTWGDVPEWKWEGPKGQWYKFDKDWTLWVNK